ncbi:hypothetical protein BRADI_1g13635v3 [Brachypodium distachyon]|uniref:Phytocyanin domain-containing protein n=2 Tax=Brachypodium distachyon TaxID=15368 RepID=I1GPZ2_BRADI|nr:hypothetical protein BRADI_1g13635v3 [Brachypodium distachyon]
MAAFLAICCFLLLSMAPTAVAATDHVVGGSIWSIPTSSGHYQAWAKNRTFFVGDNLVFKFDLGMYNVVQVGSGEYEYCTWEDPYNTFDDAPAVVNLDFPGVRYFICTVGNYCELGVKIYVTVQKPY